MSLAKNSIGIYCDGELTDETISNIKNQLPEAIDFVVFSDKPLLIQNIQSALLPSFYMYFFNHPIVFLSQNKLKSYEKKLVSTMLYTYEDNKVQKYEI